MEYFFGHTCEYWLELQRRVSPPEHRELIEEIARLRGRISFYESRIKDMAKLAERAP